MSPDPRVKSIVERIGMLEGDRDPKCDATASRLEDFMYGTPLTPAARFLKNDLQKALVVAIWSRASARAARAGTASVSAATVDHAAREIFAAERRQHDWQLTIAGQEQRLDATDKRQYSTVAYGLRAILAVEQDQLLGRSREMLPLAPEAIDALKEAVDLYTLAMLQRADRRARREQRREIDREALEAVWVAPAAVAVEAPAAAGRAAGAARGYPVLEQIIGQKIHSFEKYNSISTQVFLRNLQVYFARHRFPAEEALGTRFKALFTEAMISYSRELLRGSEALARARGAPGIAASDVYAFGQRISPHRINEYEDATFFPRLPRAERVEIEAYDMDAFRDGGLHWRYVAAAIEDDPGRGHLEPDPFAAELLTENIAQFGVLLLKEAGRLAKAAGHETLHPDFVHAGVREIRRKIALDATAPPERLAESRVLSADSATPAGLFRDVTRESGLAYRHRSSDWLGKLLRSYIAKDENRATLTIPPAFQGSGLAAEDFDGDGRPDLVLLGGAGIRLYLNAGDGRFRDATAGSGLDWRRPDGHPGEARQAVAADLDNDGRQDLLVTFVDDDHRVFRNIGGGRFEDVTATAGLGGKGLVGGPAAVLDFDRDGRADIYIAYFGNYLRGVLPTLARAQHQRLAQPPVPQHGRVPLRRRDGRQRHRGHGLGTGGHPYRLRRRRTAGPHRRQRLRRQRVAAQPGGGKFEDVTAAIGTDKPSYAMGLAIADLNGDGLPDVYVSNIVVMDKDQKYVLPGEATPMKFDPRTLANMRVLEANDLFVSVPAAAGALPAWRPSTLVDRGYDATGWSWDATFFDMDNDGDEDLYVVNGVNPYNVYSSFNPYYETPEGKAGNAYFPPDKIGTNILFANERGRLNNATASSGLGYRGNSRSVAYLDMDGDGDLDIVMNHLLEDATVYRNHAESTGNGWVMLRLEGDPAAGSTRDALGAWIVLHTTSGRKLWREVRSTGGYLSSNPKEQHFGLGSDRIERVQIRWPGGARSEVRGLEPGGRYAVREKDGALQRLDAKEKGAPR
jgi:hypothetical protein